MSCFLVNESFEPEMKVKHLAKHSLIIHSRPKQGKKTHSATDDGIFKSGVFTQWNTMQQ